jgi:VIT1/CCC1 family predicted Fe2+/Mn2+ transporter
MARRGRMARDTEAGATARHDGVRVRDVSTGEARRDPAVRAARERFGGLDWPATLVGTLTALAVLVLLGGLIGAAVGLIGYQTGLENAVEEISVASLVGGLVTLFIAFAIGGWAAGRMARYDGARNGLMTAVWAVVLAAILSALGAIFGGEYDVFRNVQLPQFFSRDALTLGAIVSALVAIAVMLVAGLLGGKWGERYHRRADATIIGTREGGVAADEPRVR